MRSKGTNPSQGTLCFDEPEIVIKQSPAPIPEVVIPDKERRRDLIRGEASRQHLIRLLNSFRYKHGIYDVFRDFCALSALSISNAVDKRHWEDRESEYLRIIKGYDREFIDKFPEMLSCLTTALDELGPRDILGEVFMQLEISNKSVGQFFTPQCVSDCMARIVFSDLGPQIAQEGYITLQEPAAGGGSTIFAACKAMSEQGFDFTTQLHVTAIDIDSRCAHMCYVQMSLLGIPGVVYHGDTLRMEMRSEWITPTHVWGLWDYKLSRRMEERVER
jgi:hypothetical protein